MIKVTCLGAAQSVTGSNFLLQTSRGRKYLVDCGLFQGKKHLESRNWGQWGFEPAEIEALFLTHAHIDHSGRIPKLVKDGFKGRIITSPPTAELCEIMLQDSAHIQEMEAEWLSRKKRRQGQGQVQPLYTMQDALNSLEYFQPQPRDQILELEDGLRVRMRNAGHILGSSILEFWCPAEQNQELKVVFSGDLGQRSQLIVQDPQQIFDADHLFLESTYGNRNHRGLEESKQELLQAIEYSYSRGGKILIPAFAVERTQEILYILGEFYRQGKLPEIPVYLDSPLAIKATEIFRNNKKYYDHEALAIVDQGLDPFDMPTLQATPSTAESMAINEQSGSAIIIAGNGMCTAGRIKHHLKHNLWREETSVVIVGFQAAGSNGRKLVEGAQQIRIFEENISVKAQVFTIGGFSAHADQKDLLSWVSNFRSSPRVFLVHGEPEASQSLAQAINSEQGLQVQIPAWQQSLILGPREVQEEAALPGLEPDISLQVTNALVDLEKSLQKLKKRTQEKQNQGQLEEEDLDRLQFVQQEISSLNEAGCSRNLQE
ncbi:MAG: MBL fold metallo-hydrolase RNA specificity domain-containing protein [Desulfohalobiaceae bacterium]